MPNCPDVKDLRRLIRDVAVELRSQRVEISRNDFIDALHAKYDDALTYEQIVFGFDEFVWDEGRSAMKKVEGAARRGADQLPLPLTMAGLDIPMALPIDRPDGGRTVVVTMHATLDDCEAYVTSIESNINACMKRLTEFMVMLKHVRPLMEANPGWTVGDALQRLCDQERSAA